MRVLVAGVLVVALLAGCFSSDDQADEDDQVVQEPVQDDFIPRVVIGILDTGVMPYHQEFRQVRFGENGSAHPSTYLPGYPADAPAVPLTLDLLDDSGEAVTDAEAYLEKDAGLWSNTTPETMYWLPGTKVVGLIDFGAGLPGSGHGSMTASRAVGNTVSIAGNETLLVMVSWPGSLSLEVGDDNAARATRWMADQPWIDIQSHSWGMPFTCAGVATQHVWGWAEAFKYARDKQLVHVAAANGHGNTGTLGYPSQCQDNSGIAGVVTVGATDNEGITTWANWFPAVAADGCSNPAIDEATTDKLSNNGGGTSSATPFSAGGAAKIVLEARRILRDPNVGIRDGVVATAHEGAAIPETGPLSDGTFTLDELKSVLFHTAISPPTADADDGEECLQHVPTGQETPGMALFPFIGYGEVNRDSVALAIEVLQGLQGEPARPQEDQAYEQDQELRRAFWG
jgi:hypothetical protein